MQNLPGRIVSILMAASGAIAISLAPFASGADDAESPVKKAEEQFKAAQKQADDARKALKDARIAEQALKAKRPPPADKLQLLVPKFSKAPVIDGVIGDEEWAAASVIPGGTGASNQGQPLKARPATIFFVGWDAENFYVAQRMPMREGEKPVRLQRKPKHDLVDCWETAVEVYIDCMGNGSNKMPCRWQFMGNACGNRWDREDEYSIGQNMISWDGEWQYKQALSPDGKYWDCEMAFPRKTVYMPGPLKDGDRWNIGLAASLQHPWQWSGFYGWPIIATFRDEAPSVRMYNPNKGLANKHMAFDMEIANTMKRPLNATIVAKLWDPSAPADKQIIVEKKIPVTLEPGKSMKTNVDEPADAAKDLKSYRFTVMVLENETSIYTWDLGLCFNDPENNVGMKIEVKPEPFGLSTRYYPLSNLICTSVDKYDLPERDKVKTARYTVKPQAGGDAIGSGEITFFDYEKGDGVLKLPADLKPGKYECVVELLDGTGKSLATNKSVFERKDHAKEFPWLGNSIGMDDVVPPIFEPVSLDGDIIKGYRKEIKLAGSALPASVKAADIDLLAGPVYLRGQAEGKPFIVESADKSAKKKMASPTHMEFEGTASGGPVASQVSYRLDYDGTARIEMTLSPGGKQPAKIENLQLVIPFKEDAATHFMANGNNMRASNVAGKLPGEGKTGSVWNSKEVRAQNMTVGSFVPIVHVGNLSSGLTWFADSDKGWWPSDKAPALELIRTGKGTIELVCNLAVEPVELREPRKIVFGICAVPVRKPSPYLKSEHVIGFGFEQESGRWDPKVTPGRVYARMYPDNPKKFKEWMDGVHSRGNLEKAYIENSSADFYEAEFQYFEPDWQSQNCRSAVDNKLYWTEKFIKDTGLDGYYMDNIFCRLLTDPASTAAYTLPDGRVQPGYDLWDFRDYTRRLRVIFDKMRNPGMLCFHNSDFQFAPVVSYADLVMGGENPLPSQGSLDYMDMWPREWMDVMFNQQLLGYSLSHLFHFPADTFKNEMGEWDREAAWKSFRGMTASMLVHGVEFWQGLEYRDFLTGRWRTFKNLPGELEFIQGSEAKGRFGAADGNKDIDVAIYRKDGALLIIIANYAKQAVNAKVKMDLGSIMRKPGPKEIRSTYDFETMENPGYIWQPDGTFLLKVEARDFRVLLIQNEIPGLGGHF